MVQAAADQNGLSLSLRLGQHVAGCGRDFDADAEQDTERRVTGTPAVIVANTT